MIVYLATYPRCGNSLLRDIIHTYFQRPTANIYAHPTLPAQYPKRLKYAQNWRLSDEISLKERLSRFWLLWDKHIALYDLNIPPYTKNVRFLTHGCKGVLNRVNRLRLSQEKTIFFLKTHERPFNRYLPGEYVIQVVRHPGPVIRSYHNLRTKEAGEDTNLTIDDFIQGNIEFGSWSDYHTRWDEAIPKLGQRFLRLKFEDIRNDHMVACDAISSFLNMPYDETAVPRSFEKLHENNPRMFGFGSNEAWDSAYTEAQLQDLYKYHGKAMQRFDYDVPSVHAGE